MAAKDQATLLGGPFFKRREGNDGDEIISVKHFITVSVKVLIRVPLNVHSNMYYS